MKHVLILLTLIIVCQLSTRAEENDTLFFDNGSWYAGQIEDSLFNGFGVMRYPDETLYSGQWKDGLWHGIGELFFPDGDKYSGEFSNHTIEGEGEYFYYNGAKYQGGWRNNMFNGAGTMYYTDGGYYAGNWQDDKRHGYGLLFPGLTAPYIRDISTWMRSLALSHIRKSRNPILSHLSQTVCIKITSP